MAGLSNLQTVLAGLVGGGGQEAQNMENARFTAGLQAQIKQAYLNALLQRSREQNATKQTVADIAGASRVAGDTNRDVNAALVRAGAGTTDANLRDATQESIEGQRAAAGFQRQLASGGAREGSAINKAREDALSATFPNMTKGQLPPTVPWPAAQEANASMAQNLGTLGYSGVQPYFVSKTAQPSLLGRLFGSTPPVVGVVNPAFPSQLNSLGAAAAGTQGTPDMPAPGRVAAPKVAVPLGGGGYSIQKPTPQATPGANGVSFQ